MVKSLIPLFFLAILAGCAKSSQPVVVPSIEELKENTGTSIINHGSGYSLRIPHELFVWGSKKFFSTISPPKPGNYPIYQLNAVGDYDVTILDSLSCSPSLIGASKTQSLPGTNGSTTWGKVDFFDIWKGDYAPGEQPRCRPMGGENGAGYAFCSEKDGKTVLICISQVTDNPKLAEEIFGTFRWK